MKTAWLRLIAVVSKFIFHRKEQIERLSVCQGFFVFLLIVVGEIILAVLCLPVFLTRDFARDPAFFNQLGLAYSTYRVRKRITLFGAEAGLALALIYLVYAPGVYSATNSIQFNSAASSDAESTASVNVQVNIDTASTTAVTVDYTVTGGTADPGDFTPFDGTLTIPANQTSANISLTVADDGVYETNETIRIELTNPSGGAILNANTVFTYTINDNDLPTVNFSAGSIANKQSDWSGGPGTSTSTQYNNYSNIYVSTTGQFELATTSGWYDSRWPYRTKITIDNTKVSADLNNFPALVTGANFPADFFTKVKTSGQDLVFTSSDGITKLSREVVSLATSTQSMQVWVNVPTVNDSTDTVIYAYYGNSNGSETNGTSAWNGSYLLVHHMEDNPAGSAPQLQDSSAGNLDGTASSTPVATSSGYIGSAIGFGDNKNGFALGSAAAVDDRQPFSISAWIKTTTTFNMNGSTAAGRVLSKKDDSCSGDWEFSIGTGGNIGFTHFTGGAPLNVHSIDGEFATNTWGHMAVTWDGTVNATGAKIYFNGAEVSYKTQTTGTNGINSDAGCDLVLGNISAASSPFHGVIDEVHFSLGATSSGWIATEYNSQSSPSTFYSLSSEENFYAASGTLTSAIFDIATTTHEWGVVRAVADRAPSTTVKVRTSSNSDMSGATAFGSCSVITNGADISGNSCVTDGHRYMQYQIGLSRMATTTPVFQEIEVEYLDEQNFSYAEDVGTITLTATLSSSTTSTVSVPYTVSGTATGGGTDYTFANGTISISAGSRSGTAAITVTNDTSYEVEETIAVTMGTPTNATAGSITVVTSTIDRDTSDINKPGTPTAGTTTETTMPLTLDDNGNAADSVYSIFVSTTGFYLAADGTTTTVAVYQTTSTWGGTITVRDLMANTGYRFVVHGRTAGGAQSATSSPSTIAFTDVAAEETLVTGATVNVTTRANAIISGTPGGGTGSFTAMNIDSTVNPASGVTLDMSRIIQDNAVLITNSISITRDTADQDKTYNLHMPSGTTNTGSSGWDGVLTVPRVLGANDISSPGTRQVRAVVELGSLLSNLTFSNPIKLTLPNLAGLRAAFERPGESPVNITLECAGPNSGSNIEGNGECYYSSGKDLIIWTKHATKYFAYDAGGGGAPSSGPAIYRGGGGGSVTAAIPAAIVINNGAVKTAATQVVVSLNVVGAPFVALSNRPDFAGASFVPFNEQLSWELSPGAGTKTVYVRFRTPVGTIADGSDTIELISAKDIRAATSSMSDEIGGVSKGEEACPLDIGRPYKSPRSPGVYLLAPPCVKQPIRSPEVYQSYFTSWNEIILVGNDFLAAIATAPHFAPYGPKIKLTEGALIKSIATPKVYALKNGAIHWLESEAVFLRLGYKFDKVLEFADEVIGRYKKGDNITAASIGPYKVNLRFQSNTEDVRTLKQQLSKLGYWRYPDINTFFGSDVEDALMEFQRDHKLKETGELDEATRAVLNML